MLGRPKGSGDKFQRSRPNGSKASIAKRKQTWSAKKAYLNTKAHRQLFRNLLSKTSDIIQQENKLVEIENDSGHESSPTTRSMHSATRLDVQPPDIIASFSDDSQLVNIDIKNNDGVMNIYLKTIHRRLQEETKNKVSHNLIQLLKENDWWLRSVHAPKVIKICGAPDELYDEPSYIRDIYVWLPDIRWGDVGTPPCPHCKTSTAVQSHGFRNNHIGRRIYNVTTHYFAMSRRYICQTCKESAEHARKSFELLAQQNGLELQTYLASEEENSDDSDQDIYGDTFDFDEEEEKVEELSNADGAEKPIINTYTFMGWNQLSLQHLPFGLGMQFPAFLTHRSGVDMHLIDMMRVFFNKGVSRISF